MKNTKVSYCDQDYDDIEKDLENIGKTSENIFLGFSFNVVDTQYFWGKNHYFLKSSFDCINCLKLMNIVSKWSNLRSLQFYDFNPQKEDYGSGVFYSRMIFEFIKNHKSNIK